MYPENIDANVKVAHHLYETIRTVESLIGRVHRSTDHYYANHFNPPPNVPEPRGTHYSQYVGLVHQVRLFHHSVGKHVPPICDYSREEYSPFRYVDLYDSNDGRDRLSEDIRETCEAAKYTTRGPVMEWCSR